MKLQQLLQEDAVIYCSIESEMIEVLEIAKKHDYKVSKKHVYFAENLINSSVQKEICIRLKTMTSGRVDTYKKNGHTVVSAIDFIMANSEIQAMKVGEPGYGGFDPNNPHPDELNFSEPVFENGEEVEVITDGEYGWSFSKYIGKDGDGHCVWHHDCYLYLENNEIRKPQPKQPKIGALCLFSNEQGMSHGVIDVLNCIDYEAIENGKYYDELTESDWHFCREIESITFKD